MAYFLDTDYPPLILAEPNTLDIGGNTNGVNTFTGLDIGNLTAGVYNSEDLLEGDNFACFCKCNPLRCLISRPDAHSRLRLPPPTINRQLGARKRCWRRAAYSRRHARRRLGRHLWQPDEYGQRHGVSDVSEQNHAFVHGVLRCGQSPWRYLLSMYFAPSNEASPCFTSLGGFSPLVDDAEDVPYAITQLRLLFTVARYGHLASIAYKAFTYSQILIFISGETNGCNLSISCHWSVSRWVGLDAVGGSSQHQRHLKD